MKFCWHNPRATLHTWKFQSHIFLPNGLFFAHYFISISKLSNLYKEKQFKQKNNKESWNIWCSLCPLCLLFFRLHRHVANTGLQQQSCEGNDLGISWKSCLHVVTKGHRCLADLKPISFKEQTLTAVSTFFRLYR